MPYACLPTKAVVTKLVFRVMYEPAKGSNMFVWVSELSIILHIYMVYAILECGNDNYDNKYMEGRRLN